MGPFGTNAKGSIVDGHRMQAKHFMVPGLLERSWTSSPARTSYKVLSSQAGAQAGLATGFVALFASCLRSSRHGYFHRNCKHSLTYRMAIVLILS